MIALVQRVASAHVTVADPGAGAARVVGTIGRGLLVFVCAEPMDSPAEAVRLVDKLLKLRVFSDANGKMNLSLQHVGGGLLLVSQFTLAADTRTGNRPGFSAAAPPAQGRELYDAVLQAARARHAPVAAGVFGAEMQVHLVNDGPVTVPLRILPAGH